MIIQTGMRTDIPAFYSDWFANRLKEGYVLVRNPYNLSQITQYSLRPDVVDLIGFCTKNPGPMLKYMHLLEPYGMFWYVTITAYDREIEPAVPPIGQVLENFRYLSEIVGIDSIGWRYDPIFITNKYSVNEHLKRFEMMARALEGYTKICVISFIDLYQKVRKNFPEVSEVSKEDRLFLGERLVRIAAEHGMIVKPCAEGDELARFGADCSGCMTMEMYEKALSAHIDFPKKRPLRKECACYMSCDIGAYNTCMHMCRYCYANYDEKTVRNNYRYHNPGSPLLTGEVQPWDKIHEADQKSWVDHQMTLDMWLNSDV